MDEIKEKINPTTQRKNRPTPPAPQNQLRRFQFFTGPNGKGISPAKIQYEMQRYAFTREGNKMFRAMQKHQQQQAMEAAKQKNKDHVTKTVKPKKSLFSGIKTAFSSIKSQRGN